MRLLRWPCFCAGLLRLQKWLCCGGVDRVDVLVEEAQVGALSIHNSAASAACLDAVQEQPTLVALGWAGRGLGLRFWPDGTAGGVWFDTCLFLCLVLLATLVSGLLPKAWASRPSRRPCV